MAEILFENSKGIAYEERQKLVMGPTFLKINGFTMFCYYSFGGSMGTLEAGQH